MLIQSVGKGYPHTQTHICTRHTGKRDDEDEDVLASTQMLAVLLCPGRGKFRRLGLVHNDEWW